MTMAMENALIELRKSVEDMHGAKTERIGSPSLGDVVRQGDLYLVCIDKLPENGIATTNRQLVPGSTQGSRHVIEGDCNIVEKVQYQNRHIALCGPAFSCISDCTIIHPEHGHKILPAKTVWHCVYQQAYADEIRRVQD